MNIQQAISITCLITHTVGALLPLQAAEKPLQCDGITATIRLNNHHTTDMLALDGTAAISMSHWDEIYTIIPVKGEKTMTDTLHYNTHKHQYEHKIKFISSREFPHIHDIITIRATEENCLVTQVECRGQTRNTHCQGHIGPGQKININIDID